MKKEDRLLYMRMSLDYDEIDDSIEDEIDSEESDDSDDPQKEE
jgi:hypothetical protein